jgi:ABC-type polysaccharide/polyol phosphate export permease
VTLDLLIIIIFQCVDTYERHSYILILLKAIKYKFFISMSKNIGFKIMITDKSQIQSIKLPMLYFTIFTVGMLRVQHTNYIECFTEKLQLKHV